MHLKHANISTLNLGKEISTNSNRKGNTNANCNRNKGPTPPGDTPGTRRGHARNTAEPTDSTEITEQTTEPLRTSTLGTRPTLLYDPLPSSTIRIVASFLVSSESTESTFLCYSSAGESPAQLSSRTVHTLPITPFALPPYSSLHCPNGIHCRLANLPISAPCHWPTTRYFPNWSLYLPSHPTTPIPIPSGQLGPPPFTSNANAPPLTTRHFHHAAESTRLYSASSTFIRILHLELTRAFIPTLAFSLRFAGALHF